jgi:PhnB protein
VSDGALGRQASMMPQLSVRRGRAAVAFYKAAFGVVEDYRVGGTDDDESVVAQLSVGTASFWVADESPPHGTFSPESLGGGTVRMLLIVDDPGSVVARAVAAGATEVSPVGEEHGWRRRRVSRQLAPACVAAGCWTGRRGGRAARPRPLRDAGGTAGTGR